MILSVARDLESEKNHAISSTKYSQNFNNHPFAKSLFIKNDKQYCAEIWSQQISEYTNRHEDKWIADKLEDIGQFDGI